MNKQILKEFRKQKKEMWSQSNLALSSARSIVHFEALEDMGLVKFEWDPEISNYFDVYGRENISKKQDEEIERLIDLHGLWCAASYYLNPKSHKWEIADSCGMFIGQDANGYEGDLKQGAIDALRKANRQLSKIWKVAS